MEKRRRARINQSLALLKTLILDSTKNDVCIQIFLLVDNEPFHTRKFQNFTRSKCVTPSEFSEKINWCEESQFIFSQSYILN